MNIEDDRPPDPASREERVLMLLQRVWAYSITTKSDAARDYADEIAEAASRGFLTTLIAYGAATPVYGRLWKLTEEGIAHLRDNGHVIADKEVQNYGESFCQPATEED